ncbi:hypothetical protein AOLI_G00143420 [Acnodon oligacanthus]
MRDSQGSRSCLKTDPLRMPPFTKLKAFKSTSYSSHALNYRYPFLPGRGRPWSDCHLEKENSTRWKAKRFGRGIGGEEERPVTEGTACGERERERESEAQLGLKLERFPEAQVLCWSVEKNKHSDARQREREREREPGRPGAASLSNSGRLPISCHTALTLTESICRAVERTANLNVATTSTSKRVKNN